MILLTGADGFLGSKLKKVLNLNSNNAYLLSSKKKDGYLKCDLASLSETQSIAEQINPKIIIHCAALVPRNQSEYEESLINNKSFLINQNVEKCFKTKMIFISSMTVYKNHIVSEKSYSENLTDISLLNGYAKVKLESEYLFNNSKNIDVINLRLPGLFSEERRNGLIYNLVKAFINNENFEPNKTLPFWSTMHLNDAARVIKYFVDNFSKISHKTINVGYPGKSSIPLMIKMISSLFDKSFDIEKYETPEFEMDLKLLNKYLKFHEGILEERILNFVNHHKKINYER
tara:strand:+ start:10365 stop:11228 length:864 start_codon:yes stop_codon:yes gene_type:complete